MSKRDKRICKYCGSISYSGTDICATCNEKLPIIRKIVAIGHKIKKQAILERMEMMK